MDVFNPLWINRYSQMELLAFMACGYTLDDFRACGATDGILHALASARGTATPVNDDSIFRAASSEGTIEAYRRYLELLPNGRHVTECEAWINRHSSKSDNLTQRLIEDMKVHPQSYPSEHLRWVINGMPSRRTRENIVNGSLKIAPLLREILIECRHADIADVARSVRPRSISESTWWAMWTQPLYPMPSCTSREMSRMQDGGRDVFLLGIPRCGRTSLLAALLNYGETSLNGSYEPHTIKGKDVSYAYYKALRDLIPAGKFPSSPNDELLCFIHFAAMNHRVTFMEHAGALAAMLAQSRDAQDYREQWDMNALCSCLQNNNDKTLLILVDSGVTMAGGSQAVNQALSLEKMVQVLCSNGPDPRKAAKGCTMSRVKTLAVVFTKSDLMTGEPTVDNWVKQSDSFISRYYNSLMITLQEACERYSINRVNSNRPFLFVHSMGTPCVGDCFIPEMETTNHLAKFVFEN